MPYVATLIIVAILTSAVQAVGAPEHPGSSMDYRRADYLRARAKARAWLDSLDVDAVELMRHGIKGKKKLAEILDCYLMLSKHPIDKADHEALRRRIEKSALQAARLEYHDMAVISDREFTENSMSYLRVAWVLKLLGINIDRYRKEIEKIKPRLDADLSRRGAWQQAMFLDYYERFGLPKPRDVQPAPIAAGLIARRFPAHRFSNIDTYDFTHEVFVAFDYGNRRAQTTFSASDLDYVRDTLVTLLPRYISENDADLVGELLSCIVYFRWTDLPSHRQAVDFLLDSQNSNGTWGNYETYRAQFGKNLEHHLYLHTTMVALRPLLDTYETGPHSSRRTTRVSSP